jgi:hypothetical protein
MRDNVNTSSADILEDYLDIDPKIPNQEYALISFISPEKVLAKKDVFFFERFLQSFELDLKVKGTEKFLADTVLKINRDLDERILNLEKEGQTEQAEICRKNKLKIDDVLIDYEGFVKKNQREYKYSTIIEAYNDFMFKEQTKLEDEFHAKNEFRTSIRGFKVRGVCATQKEASIRANKLRSIDSIHDVFCAEVGKWTPWDPSTHQIENQEYAEEQLNNLMKKYQENEQDKEKLEEERRRDATKSTKSNKVIGIEKVTESTESENSVVTPPQEYSSMFDTPGDLALARKMERAKMEENNTN